MKHPAIIIDRSPQIAVEIAPQADRVRALAFLRQWIEQAEAQAEEKKRTKTRDAA